VLIFVARSVYLHPWDRDETMLYKYVGTKVIAYPFRLAISLR